MKTSVIEVHDMLSVLTVDEVEKRIGEVPGSRKRNSELRCGKRHSALRRNPTRCRRYQGDRAPTRASVCRRIPPHACERTRAHTHECCSANAESCVGLCFNARSHGAKTFHCRGRRAGDGCSRTRPTTRQNDAERAAFNAGTCSTESCPRRHAHTDCSCRERTTGQSDAERAVISNGSCSAETVPGRVNREALNARSCCAESRSRREIFNAHSR